jgi:hypothetical protein
MSRRRRFVAGWRNCCDPLRRRRQPAICGRFRNRRRSHIHRARGTGPRRVRQELTVDGKTSTQTLVVHEDPRIGESPARRDQPYLDPGRQPLGSSKLPGHEAIEALVRSSLIFPVRLSALAFEVFLELTGANPPDALGDGEAATIAQSFDIGAVPVTDERKATRVSLSLRPKHPILHTIDILACSAVTTALSRQELGDVTYAAIFHARMRVPGPCRDWVCAVVGPERAKGCPSLGSVKDLGPG